MKCNQCSIESDDESIAVLWDGKSYCKRCLEAACDGLFEFARRHPTLEEVAPYQPARIAKRHALVFCCFGLILGLAMGWVASKSQAASGVLLGLLGGLLVALLAGLVQIPPYLWMTKRMLPTLCFQAGQLTVYRGQRNARSTNAFALESLRWSRGKVRQDSELRKTFIPNQPVLVLELPDRRERVACGWTAEMRERLTAFFVLAGIPSA